jgi:hypothetical protein
MTRLKRHRAPFVTPEPCPAPTPGRRVRATAIAARGRPIEHRFNPVAHASSSNSFSEPEIIPLQNFEHRSCIDLHVQSHPT